MSLDTLIYAFGAGQTHIFRSGTSLLITDLTGNVDIELFNKSGVSQGKAINQGAGFWLDVDEFGYLKVTSATAQNVQVIIGDGRYGINQTSTNLNGGTIDLLSEITPREMGTPYKAGVINGVQTIVAPAANVSGIDINFVNAIPSAGGYSSLGIKSGAAPTDWYEADYILLLAINMVSSDDDVNKINNPIRVPAGYGLYTTGTVANGVYLSAGYTVL